MEVIALKSSPRYLYALMEDGSIQSFNGKEWVGIEVPTQLMKDWASVEFRWKEVGIGGHREDNLLY